MCNCGSRTMWKVVYADGSKSEPMLRGAALTEQSKSPGAKVVKAA